MLTPLVVIGIVFHAVKMTTIVFETHTSNFAFALFHINVNYNPRIKIAPSTMTFPPENYNNNEKPNVFPW